MADQKVMFFYLRDKRKFPVACIGYAELGERDVIYSIATHNPLDPYNRGAGKEIVLARLTSGSRYNHYIDNGINLRSRIIWEILHNCIDPSKKTLYPQRARKAAKAWLKSHKVTSHPMARIPEIEKVMYR